MDEILIEDKKYVSSKQAAKATGYAKDYIGQLCREGRVPARLVGRSWYVLESALHDHRFGNPKDGPAEVEKPASTQQSTWESPRYETFDAEELPAVNRLHKLEEKESQEPASEEVSETAQRLQETWQAWFDRFDTVAGASTPKEAEDIAEAPAEIVVEDPQTEAIEEEVPIRAIHHQPYQHAPREFLPIVQHSVSDTDLEAELPSDEEEPVDKERGEGARGTRLVRAVQVAGVVIAVIAVSLATLGSGYLDKYIISNSQVGLVAGVALYNK